METTTERIYKKDIATAKRYMKKLKIKSFAELISMWFDYVDKRIKNNFYDQLTTRDNFKRLLSNCKIDKKKICIQKIGAT